MSYLPPWTPRLHPEQWNDDGSVKRERLSYFFKQLPEQIGCYILQELRGLDAQAVQAFARDVRKGKAVWPTSEDGRVRLVLSDLPQ